MSSPHSSSAAPQRFFCPCPRGLEALIPQQSDSPPTPPDQPQRETVVVQVAEGRLRINQQEITWELLGPRIAEIFKWRAQHVAFVEGDEEVQFHEVARAIDIMRTAGVESIGLLTPRIMPAQ